MSEEIPMANPALSAEERSVVTRLTDGDLEVIDATILANSSDHWRKVARVIWDTEKALSDRFMGVTYIFYAQRLIHLVDRGQLESQGNLEHMRFSEIRLPSQLAV